MDRLYRLPNSGTTQSRDEYVKAWEYFAHPLCVSFGWDLRGFDPGFQFETTGGQIVTLDSSVVMDIRAGLRTMRGHIDSLSESNRVNQAALMQLLAVEVFSGRKP